MQARYVMGAGPRRFSYIVGVGKSKYDRTVHHGASCPAWPAPCPPDTPGSGRADENVIEGGLLWLPLVRPACFAYPTVILSGH